MKIGIFGAGYVGYSLGLLLSQQHDVKVFDIDLKKIDLINSCKPILGEEIEKELLNLKGNSLHASLPDRGEFKEQDYFIIALPVNYDAEKHFFDSKIIEKTIDSIRQENQNALIVIKSTIPIGYTKTLQKKYDEDIIFSPEFLREGSSLEDNQKPTRIVVGSKTEKAIKFGKILKDLSKIPTKIIYTESSEAESIKLFSNAYLATRVSFFNELDNFAIENKLSAKEIIDGISLDPRIGANYNNPSFGYGGYCLPKDTKQLLSNFGNIPAPLFRGIVDSNNARKEFISKIISENYTRVGIYKLAMKKDSDNFRESAVIDIINKLSKNNIKLVIFDDSVNFEEFNGIQVTKDFDSFIQMSEIILANRFDRRLQSVKEKVFSRDIYGNN